MQGKSSHHNFWTRFDHETICIGDVNDHVHCKVHKYGKIILNFLGQPCELCNEHGHLNLQCKLFHDQIVSKNCDNLITLDHHKELSLLLGYEEMKRITEGIPKFNLDRFLDFDLEEIYMYCAVNCIENPYIANYIKKRKHIED